MARTVVVRMVDYENDDLDLAFRMVGWNVRHNDAPGLPTGVEIYISPVPEQGLCAITRLDGVGGPRIVKLADMEAGDTPAARVAPVLEAVTSVLISGLQE